MKYSTLVDLYEVINHTSKRLEKTHHIADFIKKLNEDEIEHIIPLIKGRINPEWNRKELGISTKLVIKAIGIATGASDKEIEEEWKSKGDIGDAATSILKRKKQMTLFQESLSTEQLIKDLRLMSEMQGAGSTEQKTKSIAKLINAASPDEAKFIIRTVLEDLRTGASEGVLRDSICLLATDEIAKIRPEVEHALNMTNDSAKVAKALRKDGLKGLEKIELTIGIPITLMLYPKVSDIEEAFKVVEAPAALEYKYDGFRVQIHKKGNKVMLFTRRLDQVTEQFPDVIKIISEHVTAKNCILDAEVVGYDPKTKEYLPFQNISQRIRRKYNIEDIAKKFPVELNVFDLIELDGSMLKRPFKERRENLSKIVKEEDKKILLAKQIITDNVDVANKFYKESLKKGFEGIMAKSLKAPYQPGRRIGYGVKLKPVMEELDLVITKAEWGTGKRGRWITSYTVSCLDEEGNFAEIGKVSSGLKELESEGLTYSKMTELITPLITKENGKDLIVKPELIIEVHYEEIQTSHTYSSGYALRFPRIIRLRDDKGLDEIADLQQIDVLFKKQKR